MLRKWVKFVLTYQRYLKRDNPIFSEVVRMSKKANNLYNQAMWLMNHEMKVHGKTLSYGDLDKITKQLPSSYNNYRLLPAQTAQQTLRQLDSNIKGYWAAFKDYQKHPEKYKAEPKKPRFRQKGGRSPVIFCNQQFRCDGKNIRIPRLNNFLIRFEIKNATPKQMMFLPHGEIFKIFVSYETLEQSDYQGNGLVASTDPGLEILSAVAFSDMSQPVLFSGKKAKNYNVRFNEKMARVQSELKVTTGKHHSKKTESLWRKRKGFFDNHMHQVSRELVNLLAVKGVSTLIIGKNDQQKQKNKIKNFVQVPIFRLLELIKEKAERIGIRVVVLREAYTSGTSFLDNEEPIKANYDKARRVERGLFISNEGRKIHADVNGAYQIMRRAANVVWDGTTHIFNPQTITC